MFSVVITDKGGSQRRLSFDKNEITIGRVQGNDVILPKGNVSKRHSRLVLKDKRFIVVDLKSTNGTYVNGRRITSPLVIRPGDKIYVGDFIMTVEAPDAGAAAAPAEEPKRKSSAPPPPLPPSPPEAKETPAKSSPSAPPRQTEATPSAAPPPAPPARPEPPQAKPAVDAPPKLPPQPEAPPADAAAEEQPPKRPGAQTLELEQAPDLPKDSAPPQPSEPPLPAAPASASPSLPAAPLPTPQAPGPLSLVMKELSKTVEVSRLDVSLEDAAASEAARSAAERAFDTLQKAGTIPSDDKEALVQAAVYEAVGLGVLELYMTDHSVREVVVDNSGVIAVDHGDGLRATPGAFSSRHAATVAAKRLLVAAGVEPGTAGPLNVVSLPDGSQASVLLPPLAVGGPVIEIRRGSKRIDAESLVARGFLSKEMVQVFESAVAQRCNIVVMGPVGSGVTTVLSLLASFVDKGERVLSVEDVPDLVISSPSAVRLCAVSAGDSSLTLGQVIQQAYRMRADRVVIDDLRGATVADAVSLLDARQGGDFIGVHTQRDEKDPLAPLKAGLGVEDARSSDTLARCLQLVVQVEAFDNGSRVVDISEVTGVKGSKVQLQKLFSFEGDFKSSGKPPKFAAE